MCPYVMILACILVKRFVDVVCSVHLILGLLPLLPLFFKLMVEKKCLFVRNHGVSCLLDASDKEQLCLMDSTG
jgi:hypothetical protein